MLPLLILCCSPLPPTCSCVFPPAHPASSSVQLQQHVTSRKLYAATATRSCAAGRRSIGPADVTSVVWSAHTCCAAAQRINLSLAQLVPGIQCQVHVVLRFVPGRAVTAAAACIMRSSHCAARHAVAKSSDVLHAAPLWYDVCQGVRAV